MAEANLHISGDRALAAEEIKGRFEKKDFIPDFFRPPRVIRIRVPRRVPFRLEERDDFVFQPEFRVHEKKGKMRLQVFQTAEKLMNLIPLDVFRRGGFHLHIYQSAFHGRNHIEISAEAGALAAQAVKSRAGELFSENFGHEPLESRPQAGWRRLRKAVILSFEAFRQPQLRKGVEVFISDFRGRITDHVGDPERAPVIQDLPQKKTEGIFFKELIKTGLHLFRPKRRKKQMILRVEAENIETPSPQHPFELGKIPERPAGLRPFPSAKSARRFFS